MGASVSISVSIVCAVISGIYVFHLTPSYAPCVPDRQTLVRIGIQVRPNGGRCDWQVDLCKRVLPRIEPVNAKEISLHLVSANFSIARKRDNCSRNVAFGIQLAIIVYAL